MIGTPKELAQHLFTLDPNKKYELKEHKEKRTHSQNSYCWKLINEIANKMRLSKEEVYLDMLKHYGQSQVVSIVSNVNLSGYFKYFEIIGTSTLNDKEFNHIRVFKGSSEYDTKEMAIFIDGIIEECKNLGIETLTYDEIAKFELYGG